MQDSRSQQERDIQTHVDQTLAMQEEAVQDATPTLDRMTRLLAKVPQLSLLATAFFAAAPILANPNTMGGSKHG
jgi:hypothetical protein